MAEGGAGPSGASNVVQAPEEHDSPYVNNIHDNNNSGLESILRGAPESLGERLRALANQTQEAGIRVRHAAGECRRINAYAEESAALGERRSEGFERKARKTSSRSEAERYRRTAENLDSAAKLTVRRADDFDTSLRFADNAVRVAVLNSRHFLHEMQHTEVNDIAEARVNYLNYTRRNANHRIAYLKEDEYYTLKAMRRCWDGYPPPSEGELLQDVNDDPSTPLIPRDQTGNGLCKWISTILTIIVAIVGVLLFILCATLSTDKYSFGGMLTVGILSAIWTIGFAIAKIIERRTRKKKELAYDERRNFMLNFIDERLNVLSEYFVTNRMTVLPDADEERDPRLRLARRRRPELLNPSYGR